MKKSTLENKIHEALKNNMKEIVYLVWLSDAKIDVSDVGNKVTIIAGSEFKARTIESALYKEIEEAICEATGFEPEIDYAYNDGVIGKTFSVYKDKTPQKRLDEMKELLECIITIIYEKSDDVTKRYVANEMRSGCVLSVDNNIAYFDFNYLDLLKVVRKELSNDIIAALKEVLDTDDIKLRFMYCSIEYEEYK